MKTDDEAKATETSEKKEESTSIAGAIAGAIVSSFDELNAKPLIGFARLSPEERSANARRAALANKRPHRFDSEEARRVAIKRHETRRAREKASE